MSHGVLAGMALTIAAAQGQRDIRAIVIPDQFSTPLAVTGLA